MNIKCKRIIFICLILYLTLISRTWAIQAGTDIFGLDFRFNNPGARANAMGGAFIGLADDATAGYTNPAGLKILADPEISLEFKYGEYVNRIFNRDSEIDYGNYTGGISFLSLAYPTERATIAIFRHQMVNISSRFNWVNEADNLEKVDIDMSVVANSFGFSLKVHPKIFLGFSVGFAELNYLMTNHSYDDASTSPVLSFYDIVNDQDNAEHYTISLLINPIDSLKIGLVYRYGPEFDIVTKRNEDYNEDEDIDLKSETKNLLKIPDVYGLGISYQILDSLTIAFDLDYIQYSNLIDEFLLEDGSGLNKSDFKIDDTVEAHGGFEYVFSIQELIIAFRAGYFYRPDHRIYYQGPVASFRETLKKREEDEHIVSLGFGTVILEQIQLDMAASYSELITDGTFSMVYRF